jgi:hypothetical protein
VMSPEMLDWAQTTGAEVVATNPANTRRLSAKAAFSNRKYRIKILRIESGSGDFNGCLNFPIRVSRSASRV